MQQRSLFLNAEGHQLKAVLFRSSNQPADLCSSLASMQKLTRDEGITIYANGALNRKAINSTCLVFACKQFECYWLFPFVRLLFINVLCTMEHTRMRDGCFFFFHKLRIFKRFGVFLLSGPLH